MKKPQKAAALGDHIAVKRKLIPPAVLAVDETLDKLDGIAAEAAEDTANNRGKGE